MTSPANPYPALISLAVHEFRTPASVVGGYLRMLQSDQEAPMSERQIRMIDQAAKSCERLVAIVAELNEIGKLDSELITLARGPVDFFSLIGEVAGLVHEAADRGVHLTATGPATGASITGDSTRLRAALDAVLRGVLREKPGAASVIAERRREMRDGRECAVLIIAEEGQTQAAYDEEPGVFDDLRGGLGLALPLARRVIEGLGGHIWSPAATIKAVIIAFPL